MESSVKQYIISKFKNKLTKDKYNLYIKMGEFLDQQGTKSFSMSPEQVNAEYQSKFWENPNLTPITLDEWNDFLNDKIVSDFLLRWVIKSKNTTLRQFISDIGSSTKLDQGTLKALNALNELINDVENDNNVVYIQYTTPIRYGDNDEESIIESLTLKNYEHNKK